MLILVVVYVYCDLKKKKNVDMNNQCETKFLIPWNARTHKS